MGTRLTIDEFKKTLKENGLDRELLNYKGKYVGYVTIDMEYKHEYCCQYFPNVKDAFDLALDRKHLEKYIDDCKCIRSKEKVDINVTEKNISYDPRIESTERKHVFSGTLDEVFERLEKENNRLRYCNGHYFEFDDNEHRRLYRMWTRLIPYWRSFNLYYGNGIVD